MYVPTNSTSIAAAAAAVAAAATAATTFASISFLLEQHVLRMRLSPQRVFVDTPSKRSSTTLCPGLAEVILVQFQMVDLFFIKRIY